MATSIRQATRDDLSRVVALATDAQSDPDRLCAYIGDDAVSIATDVESVAGPTGGDWTTATWVAVGDGHLEAWVLADTDPEMRRIWWWGPILAESTTASFDETASSLFQTAFAALPGYEEHELAFDDRSVALATFAARHGFEANASSAVLTTPSFGDATSPADADVLPIAEHHHNSVIALHDALFPGTHTSGTKLVEADDDHVRLVIEGSRAEDVVGYVATEKQSDGSLYIDFLGVATDRRGEGLGRRLVAEAMRFGAKAGATHAHLTVRTTNGAARQLYRSLGFVEERTLVPYRRGFTLD